MASLEFEPRTAEIICKHPSSADATCSRRWDWAETRGNFDRVDATDEGVVTAAGAGRRTVRETVVVALPARIQIKKSRLNPVISGFFAANRLLELVRTKDANGPSSHRPEVGPVI